MDLSELSLRLRMLAVFRGLLSDPVAAELCTYLDSLENWNYAKVCSYTLGKRYTTTVLMEKWKEVIEAIG